MATNTTYEVLAGLNPEKLLAVLAANGMKLATLEQSEWLRQEISSPAKKEQFLGCLVDEDIFVPAHDGTLRLDQTALRDQARLNQALAQLKGRLPGPPKAKREYKLILPEGVINPPRVPRDDGKGKDGDGKSKGLTSSLFDPHTIGGQISTEFLAEFAADMFTKGGHSSVSRAAATSAGGMRGFGRKVAKGAGLALMAAPVAALGIPFWNRHKRQVLAQYVEEVVEDINAAMTIQELSFQEMRDVKEAYVIIWQQVLIGVGKADGKYDNQERLVDTILRTVCFVVFDEADLSRKKGNKDKRPAVEAVLGPWDKDSQSYSNPPRFTQFPPFIRERTVVLIEEALGIDLSPDSPKNKHRSKLDPMRPPTFEPFGEFN